MNNKNSVPQDQVFWYLQRKTPNQLRTTIKTDVVIVGGGMAGLTAAQSFKQKGRSVVLVEKNYCGAGASGKSSGFITPDSELDLNYFKKIYGSDDAKKLWEFVLGGAELIRNNINNFKINCDYQVEDTLIVSNSTKSLSELEEEFSTRTALGYKTNFYQKKDIPKILGSEKYFGGLSYSDTFAIDAYLYCQSMKDNLEESGVKLFEETPAISIDNKGINTPYGRIDADYIIVCVDRFLPDLNKLKKEVFHAQTFLMISNPLDQKDIKKIFPENNYMVWDTDLIYQYYRIVENNRFMLGGSDLLHIFWGSEQHNSNKIFNKLDNYVKDKFPDVKINFEFIWPGLIGVSKDIMPLCGRDKDYSNIYYISAAQGLPWAAALGNYSAQSIIDGAGNFDDYFSPYRKFAIDGILQSILGKRITFSLSNLMALYKSIS